ncbi:MAG TPA: type II toxin-antitoxin system prevent-host-death family antitoxin [Chloroflexota bacterium]|jgi:antitoxin YefM
MIETSYSEARANFARYLDKAIDDRETILVQRRGRPDVAIIAADELASLIETAHLLRSPANARRLTEALDRAERGEGVRLSVDDLRRQTGLAAEE